MLGLIVCLSFALQAQPSNLAREEQAYSVGIQAYIYGLAPNILELTRQQAAPADRRNRFGHAAMLATHRSRAVVAPNNDTLYSTAWLDLAQGPLVLHVPPIARYHTFQFLDAYTNNFAYVGTRATGSQGGDFLIHGPSWRGSVPNKMRAIAAPTNTVWIIGRILVDGSEDIPNVAALQTQITLRALNGTSPPEVNPRSPLDRGKPVVPLINAMNPQEFYGGLARAITENPPPARDEAMLKQFEQIGIKAGSAFDFEKLDEPVRKGLTRALAAGGDIVRADAMKRLGAAPGNGWNVADIRPWGVDYLRRARVALFGLGGLDPEEALYPGTTNDATGQPLSGAKRYVLRFEPKQLPPVNAFWSLTIYDKDRFLVDNPIARYAIGDRTKGLLYEPDGALLIYLQHDKPEGKESNWLPAPQGSFSLNLRLYLPKPQALDGTWKTPKILPVSDGGSVSELWNRFRGPNGSGVASDGGYPTEFGKNKNMTWRTPVRPGKSSPVLTSDRIFLTAAEKGKLYTQCFDRKTGKLLWERAFERPHTEVANKLNHEAAATPVTDGENVFVFFKDFGFVSYDGNGKERWRTPLGPFNNMMGIGASPILAGDFIVLEVDQTADSFIAGLDRRSGELRWKVARDEAESWGTPLVFHHPGAAPKIATVARGQFGLHDVASGKRTATLPGIATTIVGSPVLAGGTLYFFGYGGDAPAPFSTRLERMDKNKDGKLTPDEYGDDPIMTSIGKNLGNQDGIVSEDEWDTWQRKVLGPNYLGALKIENGQARELWRQGKNFNGVIPSALVYQNVLYVARNGGILASHDPATGNIIKQARLDGALGGYSSSPVGADGKVWLASEEGKVSVLRAAGQWEVLAINDLGEACFATPALAGGVIYLRTDEALYAFAPAIN